MQGNEGLAAELDGEGDRGGIERGGGQDVQVENVVRGGGASDLDFVVVEEKEEIGRRPFPAVPNEGGTGEAAVESVIGESELPVFFFSRAMSRSRAS